MADVCLSFYAEVRSNYIVLLLGKEEGRLGLWCPYTDRCAVHFSVRSLVWTELRRYRLRALRLPGFSHTYLTDRLPLADNLIQKYSNEPLHFHCYIAQKDPAQPRLSRSFEKKDGHGPKHGKHHR